MDLDITGILTAIASIVAAVGVAIGGYVKLKIQLSKDYVPREEYDALVRDMEDCESSRAHANQELARYRLELEDLREKVNRMSATIDTLTDILSRRVDG